MSTNATLDNELILDIRGEPLAKNSTRILRALNHLMTVGTYYSLEHEQYLSACRKACGNIVAGIGKQETTCLEISSEGMMVGKQIVEPNQRDVRQLYDLLVALNVARLEINQGLTPEDLRSGLQILHEKRLQLGSCESFREITLDGLPATFSTAGCHLFSSGKVADRNPDEDTGGKSLAKKFLTLLEQLVDGMVGKGEKPAPGPGYPGHLDPQHAAKLEALVSDLQGLAAHETEPQRLLTLIQQVQKALELSRNPGSVDLVFRLLNKEARPDQTPISPDHKSPVLPTVHQDQALDDLHRWLDSTTAAATSLGPFNPAQVKGDFLGICLQLFQTQPPESNNSAVIDAFARALNSPEVGLAEVGLCARGIAAGSQQDLTLGNTGALATCVVALRESHLELLPVFWGRLWELLANEQHDYAWPLLVNDFLLGMGRIPAAIKPALLEALGSVSFSTAKNSRDQLFALPAFSRNTAVSTIFSLPPVNLAALHAIMLESPLARWHGPRLQRALTRRSSPDLFGVVIRLVGGFRRENAPLLAGMLEERAEGTLSPEVRETLVLVLQEGLINVSPARRKEEWVVHALEALGRLSPADAADVCSHILHDRRLLFGKAWPEACRDAAERLVESWNSASAI